MNIKHYHACDRFNIETVERPDGFNMQYLHYHEAYELYFLEMGQHGYLINDKYIQVSTQDVVLLEPNILHKSHNSKHYSRTCVYFTHDFLKEFYTDAAINQLLTCFGKDIISLDKETYFKAQRLLDALKKLHEKDDDYGVHIFLGNLLRLLCNHKENPRKEPTVHITEKVNPIISYISEHYREITHLDDISAQFYISTPHLCRIFKKHTGMTVSHYINHVKLQHGCELLVHTDKNITEIALECGFNSSMYFCKTFKAQIGCTPSEFRETTGLPKY